MIPRDIGINPRRRTVKGQALMEDHGSRISNVPFSIRSGGDGPHDMYETTFRKHFKYLETTLPKRETLAPPVSPNFHHRDLKRIREHHTETSSSFPPHQPVPVIQPKQTHATMHSTNFKVHSDRKSETFRNTTTEDFQHLPTSVTKPVLPITSVGTNLPKSKFPQPTYRSCYITHEVPPVLKAKPMENTGVGSTLTEDKNSKFVISSYNELFQNRWCPPLPPLQSVEQQRIQHSSLVMGDQEKISENQTTYSSFFRQSGDLSPAILNELLLPKIKKSQPFNLRELADDEWNTTTSEQFPIRKCDPVHLVRKYKNLSTVFEGETFNQDRITTTNQSFFPEISHMSFPVHVKGANLRTLSNVEFGRPDLSVSFYSTTSHEQFSPKEIVRPRPHTYPSSHMLFEQEPYPMQTTMQKDFVPQNCGRQQLSPWQLQRVKESHIRPQLSTCDFRTTHNEVFVPKPYSKASLDNPPFQHISHVCF